MIVKQQESDNNGEGNSEENELQIGTGRLRIIEMISHLSVMVPLPAIAIILLLPLLSPKPAAFPHICSLPASIPESESK